MKPQAPQQAVMLTTDELADLYRCSPQTIRKNYCQRGHFMSLRPVKLPNRMLRWSAAEALALIGGAA